MGSWDQPVSLLVPVVMFGWVPLTAALFRIFPDRQAVLISAIGGFLLLPVATVSLPGVPDLGKSAFVAISLVVGSVFSRRAAGPPEWGWYDLPMAVWCFLVPVATSLSNGLGLYDGVSGVLTHILNWGIFYWAGRTYFSNSSSLRDICIAIAVGGLVYVPLILFELRMAPTLSSRIYGFFPHSFSQHIRYGGYRPIVFMPHGLMVSQWMAISATVAYWLWRANRVKYVARVPVALATVVLLVSTALCKSANGWILMSGGLATYALFRRGAASRLLEIAVLLIPVYMVVRLLNVVAVEDIQTTARLFFDEERVQSLTVRLLQERAFGDRAMLRPLLGWGGYRRGWPVDPFTGQEMASAVDSLWVILFSTYGALGLVAAFLPLCLGPWVAFRASTRRRLNTADGAGFSVPIESAILGVVVLFFAVDSLINAPTAAIYVLIAGALVGTHKTDSSVVSIEGRAIRPHTRIA